MIVENGFLGGLLIFCVIVLSYAFCYYFQMLVMRPRCKKPIKDQTVMPELPPFPFSRMTPKQLLEYDGTRNDGRILISFKGKIYDVSSGLEEFSPQGVLGCVAGRNFSEYLSGTLQPLQTRLEFIERWEKLLNKNYPMVGVMIDDDNFDDATRNNTTEDIMNGNNTIEDTSDEVQIVDSSIETDVTAIEATPIIKLYKDPLPAKALPS